MLASFYLTFVDLHTLLALFLHDFDLYFFAILISLVTFFFSLNSLSSLK